MKLLKLLRAVGRIPERIADGVAVSVELVAINIADRRVRNARPEPGDRYE